MPSQRLRRFFKGSSSRQAQQGQTLVSAIVAAGVASILILAMTTMQANQQKETRALSEILASEDLQKILTSALADGTVCKYIVNNPVVLTFNSTAVSSANPQVLTPSLPIYASVNTSTVPVTLGAVLAEVGFPVSAYSQTLYASSITLSISGAPSPMPAPGPGATFTGNWVVAFDQTKTIRPVISVQVSTTLTVDTTAPAAAKVTACMANAASSGGSTTAILKTACATWNTSGNAALLTCVPPACPAGWTDLGITDNVAISGYGNNTAANDYRACLPSSSYAILEVRSGVYNATGNSQIQTCIPGPCPGGYTDLGALKVEFVSMSHLYAGNGAMNTTRVCVR